MAGGPARDAWLMTYEASELAAAIRRLDLINVGVGLHAALGIEIPEADYSKGRDARRVRRLPGIEDDAMKPFPHRYVVKIAGDAAGPATLSSEGVPDLPTAPPREFDGPGDAWSPEQLLLAAVQACFLMTFRAVAAASRIEFTSVAVDAEGTVDRADGRTRFTEIVLRPRVVTPAGVDAVKLRRALEKAEHACLVSASLSTPIRLEPEPAG